MKYLKTSTITKVKNIIVSYDLCKMYYFIIKILINT